MTKYRTKTFSKSYDYCEFDLYGYKRKPMTYETDFDTYEDAVKSAKKIAQACKEDVEIWAVDSVVRFPEPNLTVEKVVNAT